MKLEAETIAITLHVPRSSLTVIETPVRVTQKNCEHVLGLPVRTFLGLVRDFRTSGGEVLEIGKLRSVRLDAFEAWLRARASRTVVVAEPLDAVDEYAALLGFVKV